MVLVLGHFVLELVAENCVVPVDVLDWMGRIVAVAAAAVAEST